MADKAPSSDRSLFQAIGLAWDLGYTIAIPLVILALTGRLADRYLDTSPWFMLLGVLVSIFVSTWLIVSKTRAIVAADEAKAPAPAGQQRENKL